MAELSDVYFVDGMRTPFGRAGEKGMYFDPAEDKVYRHPTFYRLPGSVDHM